LNPALTSKRVFGLIGFPLGHSFSKGYFSQKFSKQGITDAEYNNYPLEDIGLLPDLLTQNPAILGLNVTIPYKESVLPFLTSLDETARSVGAVNTIRIRTGVQGIELEGFNTDVYGFRQSIKPFLESHHERALILGTGGASKAVAYVLKEIGVDCYFVSRKAQDETKAGTQKKKHFLYSEITEHVLTHFPLIVNTSPLGMFPAIQEKPPIPYEFLSSRHFLYDLIYNPEETAFLREGKQRGALTLNGLSMLQQQAEKAWEIWNS
jgi:shikimate dehydrogenase